MPSSFRGCVSPARSVPDRVATRHLPQRSPCLPRMARFDGRSRHVEVAPRIGQRRFSGRPSCRNWPWPNDYLVHLANIEPAKTMKFIRLGYFDESMFDAMTETELNASLDECFA